ncbi:type II secretion system protein F [alpha proteobacterium Q-1]|nr:type II secretion system protein F [alpha proteobacterium Q-1]
MPAFDYEALDARGKSRKGIITADSPRQARLDLRARKLMPVALGLAQGGMGSAGQGAEAESTAKSRMRNKMGPKGSLNQKQLSLVTRQLATLLDAGAPVDEALQSIAMQADHRAVRRILLAVRADVMEGRRLSQAMARHPGSFNPLYRALVDAGETSGALGTVLLRLSVHLEKSRAMRTKIVTALIYPIMLAITAVVVIIALMTFVVPKVVDQFDHLGQSLPALTLFMISLSDIIRDHGLMILLGLGGVGGAVRLSLRREAVARRVSIWLLAMPILGRLIRAVEGARLARTLATLVASGVPVVESLESARPVLRSMPLQDALGQVITQVREGSALAQALRRLAVFPPLIVYMSAVGERSGQLPQMLEKAADYLESEFEQATQITLGLLEPAIIIIMGAMVALIVLSILLPILQLNSLSLL